MCVCVMRVRVCGHVYECDVHQACVSGCERVKVSAFDYVCVSGV